MITIGVSLTIKGIEAQDWAAAKRVAYNSCAQDNTAYAVLNRLEVFTFEDFAAMCRVYKEANGTFTVRIP